MELIKDLGYKRLTDGRLYMMALFRCPICKEDAERIKKTAIKATYCSVKCYVKTRTKKGNGRAATLMKGSYLYDYCPKHPYANLKGYGAQHRLVAEKMIGRFLLQAEHVHHINEIKTDNRKENLMVLTASEHGKIHAELRRSKIKSS
jgi:DNA-directed RNA polymerase subunit RPC12/RpoP